MDYVVVVDANAAPRRVAWIGIQPDDSVSVGLNDRAFIAPDFEEKQYVWNVYNRVSVQYLVPEHSDRVRGIPNPHLTVHPPAWFQLGITKGKKIFEGIGDLQIMLNQDGIVPWIRFVTRQVSKLKSGPVRAPDRTRILTLPAPTYDCSIGLGVDFVLANDIHK